MKILFFTIANVLIAINCIAQKIDTKLQKQIEALSSNFKGNIGIYIHNLKSNQIVAINADTTFPTASIVKVPIMLGIINKINNGALLYHQKCIYKDSLLYAGEDILGSFKSYEQIELSKLLMLMLTTSDNTASLWLQSLAGGGASINNLLDTLGFNNTRVNSRTPGREANRSQFGWGQTTPKEMSRIFETIHSKTIISPVATNAIKRLLKRQYWDGEALSALPPSINVISKNGAVDASRSEILLASTPNGPIIISIFTKNNEDKSWETNNEAWQITRQITNLVYNYYNPKHKYEMPTLNNLQKWY